MIRDFGPVSFYNIVNTAFPLYKIPLAPFTKGGTCRGNTPKGNQYIVNFAFFQSNSILLKTLVIAKFFNQRFLNNPDSLLKMGFFNTKRRHYSYNSVMGAIQKKAIISTSIHKTRARNI